MWRSQQTTRLVAHVTQLIESVKRATPQPPLVFPDNVSLESVPFDWRPLLIICRIEQRIDRHRHLQSSNFSCCEISDIGIVYAGPGESTCFLTKLGSVPNLISMAGWLASIPSPASWLGSIDRIYGTIDELTEQTNNAPPIKMRWAMAEWGGCRCAIYGINLLAHQ